MTEMSGLLEGSFSNIIESNCLRSSDTFLIP